MTTQVYYTADELEAAYTQASAHTMPDRWRNALDRAYDLLLASDAISVEFDGFGAIALAYIPSQRHAGKVHTTNGTCDCEAAQAGQPCTHRAAKRLLNIAHEYRAAHPQQGRTLTLAEVQQMTPAELLNKPAHPQQQPVPAPSAGADDLFKPEDETHEERAQRVARRRSSVPTAGRTAAELRTGVSREQAYADMAECFPD